jgi:hypothetical protein
LLLFDSPCQFSVTFAQDITSIGLVGCSFVQPVRGCPVVGQCCL